jgi:hypothetical protein
VRSAAAVLAIIVLAAAPAAAQGNGNGLALGRYKNKSTPPPASSTPTSASASASAAAEAPQSFGVRQFGSWLDDASLVEPSHGYASMSIGHYRSLGGRQTDFPIVDGAFGLTPRLQVGVSVPYYRMTFNDGTRINGLGDVYLSTKVALVAPENTESHVGLALSPVLEVLGNPDPIKNSRLFWGLPVNVEMRRDGYRVYGSGGYFSRGALFGSGALEVPLHERVIATGVLAYTRALNADPGADALGLSKFRMDVSGAAAYVLSPSFVLFGSLGRTISTKDANASSLVVSGGISVSFVGRSSVRGRTR